MHKPNQWYEITKRISKNHFFPLGCVHFSFKVGANWVHFSNMKKSEINPIELMVKEAHLKTVSDDYSDVIFRYKGCMGERPCH